MPRHLGSHPIKPLPKPRFTSPPFPHAEFLADNPVLPYAVHVVVVRSDLMAQVSGYLTIPV